MLACASAVDPPMCGVRRTLSKRSSGETKGSSLPFGSTGKTSIAAPADGGIQRGNQSVDVDHRAARGVDQVAARPHPRASCAALIMRCVSAVSGTQADHVGGGQQRVERCRRSALPSASLASMSKKITDAELFREDADLVPMWP